MPCLSKRNCVSCDQEFEHDWTSHEARLPLNLCSACRKRTEENPTPSYVLLCRLEKKRHSLSIAAAVLRDIYRDLMVGQRTPEKVILEEQRDVHYKNSGGGYRFGYAWRPEDDEVKP